MKAFVAGATGRTGRQIVEVLTAKGIEVKALVRDRAKAETILPSTVELILGDVCQPNPWQNALGDCDVVFCATGATPSFDFTEPYRVDYEGTKNLIDAAQIHHVERFIFVSSLCVSEFFHPLNLFWLVLYWKKQAEKYLQQSGLNYTIVRPGGLVDSQSNDGIVIAGADKLFEGRICRRQVGEIAVEALFHEVTGSKILEVVAQPEVAPQDWGDLFASVA